MSDIKNKTEKTFHGYLKDFEPDQEAIEKGHWDNELPVKLEPDKSPLPELVFICLVVLSGFKYWGRSEKTLWEIPIKYKSLPFLLSHRKFGFRLNRKQGVDYPPDIVEEMIQKLNDAIKASEALIQPFAEQQIQMGNVSVANHYIELDMMYWFFRDKAKRAFSHPAPKPKVSKRDKDGKVVAWGLDPVRYERQGFYYALAMIDAFFSRLEHLLIIALPFIGFDPKKESLSVIMSANWTDKYKRVFDLAIDRKAKSLFDDSYLSKTNTAML